MVDFEIWALVDPLTVEQAAHLWGGLDPAKRAPEPVVLPRRQALKGAILNGKLKADTSGNVLSDLTNDTATCLVARADLRAYFLGINQRPTFIFGAEEKSRDDKSVSNRTRRGAP